MKATKTIAALLAVGMFLAGAGVAQATLVVGDVINIDLDRHNTSGGGMAATGNDGPFPQTPDASGVNTQVPDCTCMVSTSLPFME